MYKQRVVNFNINDNYCYLLIIVDTKKKNLHGDTKFMFISLFTGSIFFSQNLLLPHSVVYVAGIIIGSSRSKFVSCHITPTSCKSEANNPYPGTMPTRKRNGCNK